MKVILAFRQDSPDFIKNIGAWLVKTWTRSDFYHVEIIINDNWITATPDDGFIIKPLHKLSNKYTYVEVEVEDKVTQVTQVMKFIEQQSGAKYDWSGII